MSLLRWFWYVLVGDKPKKQRSAQELKEWKERMDMLKQERREQHEQEEREKEERAAEKARRLQEIDCLRYDAMKARYERIALEEEMKRDALSQDEDEDDSDDDDNIDDPLQTLLKGFVEGAVGGKRNVQRRNPGGEGGDTFDTTAVERDRETPKTAQHNLTEDDIDREIEEATRRLRK